MAKRRRLLKKEATKFHLEILKLIKRSFRKVPGLFWGIFALAAFFALGTLFGVGLSQKPASAQTPYQNELTKNEKFVKLVSNYEDLYKLYSYQEANLDITLNRDMIENHPDQVNAAILSIDHYRDMILVERGRIDELRRDLGLPGEDLSHQQPKIN